MNEFLSSGTFVVIIYAIINTIALIIWSVIISSRQRAISLEMNKTPQIETNKTNCRELVELTESTISLLNLINQIVETEVANMMLQYRKLAKRYNYMTLDKDAEKIAKTVFTNINWESYKKREILVKEDYLLKYISDQTITQILDFAREMNMNIPEIQA